ncbi:Hypothetical predicted protein [Olea europaea subsp. europaea]|uniref:Uncharacterized protein n=1 Tax=Olea europaea subsp. europaea TaxID=158383 RepID=A0A8S0RMN6_OLEEU|nr:Hypothetical predicted protein [Olea europaea subsp. europaea]
MPPSLSAKSTMGIDIVDHKKGKSLARRTDSPLLQDKAPKICQARPREVTDEISLCFGGGDGVWWLAVAMAMAIAMAHPVVEADVQRRAFTTMMCSGFDVSVSLLVEANEVVRDFGLL